MCRLVRRSLHIVVAVLLYFLLISGFIISLPYLFWWLPVGKYTILDILLTLIGAILLLLYFIVWYKLAGAVIYEVDRRITRRLR